MNQHYRSDINPILPVITGDYDPLSYGYGWGSATRLFPLSYGMHTQEIDDLDVLTELILPDNRSLHFNYNQFGEVAEIWINATTFLMRDVTIGIRPAVPALQTARKTHSGQRALSIALRPAMPTEQLRQLSRIGIDVRRFLGQHIPRRIL